MGVNQNTLIIIQNKSDNKHIENKSEQMFIRVSNKAEVYRSSSVRENH